MTESVKKVQKIDIHGPNYRWSFDSLEPWQVERIRLAFINKDTISIPCDSDDSRKEVLVNMKLVVALEISKPRQKIWF